MYQVIVLTEENKSCVSILSSNKLLKKWQGKFAELIVNEVILKAYSQATSFFLCRNHINLFLHQIAMLYKSAIIHYKIEYSLEQLNLSCNKYSIAEVLLLHIRMSDHPIENSELLAYFLEDFSNHNFLKFYDVLEDLESHNLIKKIHIDSKSIFYDKTSNKKKYYYDSINNKLLAYHDSLFIKYFECLNTSHQSQIYEV